ncbi:MAG: type I secretion C-terminal target domain-containing protein, partial [Amphritea sp.]
DDRSRMSGDVHVRICESLWGRFPWATRLVDLSPLLESLGFTEGGVIEDYLSFTQSVAGNAVLNVTDDGSVTQKIEFEGIDLASFKTDAGVPGGTNSELLNELVNDSKLIVF